MVQDSCLERYYQTTDDGLALLFGFVLQPPRTRDRVAGYKAGSRDKQSQRQWCRLGIVVKIDLLVKMKVGSVGHEGLEVRGKPKMGGRRMGRPLAELRY